MICSNNENPAISRPSRHRANPFADEDAQTDLVFKGACIRNTYHPTWDKIYGDPSEPATAVVFGEKGSGKTAIRLQLARHLADYNAEHPEHQVFVVEYDDFNAFLDRFRDHFSGRRRRPDRMLEQWRLWDHIDAILSLAVTQLVDRILENKQARHAAARDDALAVESLDAAQVRDVMLLAACYDQSTAENSFHRWSRLRKKLRFSTWRSKWDLGVGILVTVAAIALSAWFWRISAFGHPWPYLAVAAGWAPRLLAAAALVLEGVADRAEHPRAKPQHEAALPHAVELSRRARSLASPCPRWRAPTTATNCSRSSRACCARCTSTEFWCWSIASTSRI